MRISKLLFLALLLSLSFSPARSEQDRATHSIVRVNAQSEQEWLGILRLGLDLIGAGPGGTAHLLVGRADLAALTNARYRYEILIADAESYYRQRLQADPALGNRDWPDGSMGGYFTNSEVEGILDAWAIQYPNIMTPKMSIGTTGLTSVNNAAVPLRIALKDNTPYGEVVTINVGIAFDGCTLFEPVKLVCGVPEIIAALDMEADPGWTVGDTGDDAVTGIWERDDPIGTYFGTIPAQPGDDHTESPGSRCFVTGNGATSPDGDDVDAGKTTLKTAVFNLAGVADAVVSYWRWYADLGPVHNNDVFQADISANGGLSWVNVESRDRTANYWKEVSFKVSDVIAPTDQMMMRFIARDDPEDSTCEACIDDFEVKTYTPRVGLTLLGTPAVGSTVHVAVDAPGDAGLKYILVASRKTWPPVYHGGTLIPVKNDSLFKKSRDSGSKIFEQFAGYLDGAGHSTEPAVNIPGNPNFVGLDFYLTAVTMLPSGPPPTIKNVSAPLRIVIQ